jgi:ribosomal protein L24
MHTDLLNHPITKDDFVAVCHGAYKGTNVIKTGIVVRLTKAQVRVEISGTTTEFNYRPEKIIVINEQYKYNLSEFAEKFI